MAVGHGGVYEGLQAAFGAWLPRALMASPFAACGRFLAAFSAWCDAGQSIVALDGARYCFLPLVVLGVAHHVAAHGDAAGNEVYVVVLSVRMPHDDSHAVSKTHLMQVTPPDGLPLVGVELVLRRSTHADVHHRTS